MLHTALDSTPGRGSFEPWEADHSAGETGDGGCVRMTIASSDVGRVIGESCDRVSVAV